MSVNRQTAKSPNHYWTGLLFLTPVNKYIFAYPFKQSKYATFGLMEEIRCINKRLNKIQFYSKALVDNAHWRKVTQIEPAPLPVSEQPHEESGQMPIVNPDDLHTAISGKTILATGTPKPKGKPGRKPKNQQPA